MHQYSKRCSGNMLKLSLSTTYDCSPPMSALLVVINPVPAPQPLTYPEPTFPARNITGSCRCSRTCRPRDKNHASRFGPEMYCAYCKLWCSTRSVLWGHVRPVIGLVPYMWNTGASLCATHGGAEGVGSAQQPATKRTA